jgi:hypothetical protein
MVFGALEGLAVNKIVLEHYPADKLPRELREGLDPNARVTVTIEAETTPIDRMSLEELFSLRRDVFASIDEINRHVRSVRDELGE